MNKYIAIEGIDGCGKTTILKELKSIYHSDQTVEFIKSPLEPFRGLVENVWNFPLFDRFIFFTAANSYFANAVDSGKVYVFDRFIYSTFVTHLPLQKERGHEELLLPIIANMNLTPAATFLLRVSKTTIKHRLRERNNTIDNALDIDRLYDLYYDSPTTDLGKIVELRNENPSDLIKNIHIIQEKINSLKNI
jgi:thymidylate kinase